MSNSESYEQVSVSSDGVTVNKRFEEDEFPVPAIAFEIASERSETVDITLVDDVPGGVAVEDLGFHPEYGSEYWTIDENQITFERELESNSEYTTVYGIRATGTDDVEQFLTVPTINRVDPPLQESEDVVDEGGSDVVRDVIAGESDSVPGLDEESGGDDDIGTLDLKDPNDPSDEGAEARDAGGSEETADADGGALSASGIDASTLCGALADEIRNGNVTEDDIKLLRKAFDVVDDGSGSGGGGSGGGAVDARIERLQTDIADLRAYTDALEEFLNEEGSGEELIEDFRADVDSFRSELESFESELESVRETAGSYDEEIDALESSVEGINDDIEGVLANVKTVENDIQTVENDIQTVENDIDSVESTVQSVEGDIGELNEELENVDEVEAQIDAINEDIEELKEWREQLSSVIGG